MKGGVIYSKTLKSMRIRYSYRYSPNELHPKIRTSGVENTEHVAISETDTVL